MLITPQPLFEVACVLLLNYFDRCNSGLRSRLTVESCPSPSSSLLPSRRKPSYKLPWRSVCV